MTSKLEALRKSVLLMTDDEKMDMIRAVRNDRKQSKAPIVRERKVAKETDKMLGLMDSLSAEQKAELLAQLVGDA